MTKAAPSLGLLACGIGADGVSAVDATPLNTVALDREGFLAAAVAGRIDGVTKTTAQALTLSWYVQTDDASGFSAPETVDGYDSANPETKELRAGEALTAEDVPFTFPIRIKAAKKYVRVVLTITAEGAATLGAGANLTYLYLKGGAPVSLGSGPVT